MAASRRFHKSGFFTGFFAAVFQPLRCHPSTQCWLKALTTYWESECSSTEHGRLSASSATMAADGEAGPLLDDEGFA